MVAEEMKFFIASHGDADQDGYIYTQEIVVAGNIVSAFAFFLEKEAETYTSIVSDEIMKNFGEERHAVSLYWGLGAGHYVEIVEKTPLIK